MKKILLILATLSLIGCASPRYTATPIDSAITTNKPQIIVIRDAATRAGFLESIEKWLKNNSYPYTVAQPGTSATPDSITLEYEGFWSWDLALYLRNAEVRAYQDGKRLGNARFRVPNSMNLNKFGSAEKRIYSLMDVLFGKRSASEATATINNSD